MKPIRFPLAVLGLSLLCGSPAARAQDKVTHYDRAAKKEITTEGTIQDETAAGIKIKTGATVKEIAAGDISEVVHQVANVPRLTYGSYFNKEKEMLKATREQSRKKLLDETLKGYRELLPKVSGNKFAQRQVHFKIALLLARQAEDDPEAVEPALKELTQFKDEYPNSWQILRVARLLGDLQLRNNDLAAAEKTYSDLARSPDLPKDVRREVDLQLAQLLIEGRKYDEAEQKLKSLGVAPTDPLADHVEVYLALCTGVRDKAKLPAVIAQIEATIEKAKDPKLKAVAYNALGDCYRLNGQLKDAVWEYLHVDMVYNQDRRQRTRALEQLAKLFDELKDEKHAQEYRDKLKKEK
jgi:tetratricopeptide (TPR) repeat protein